MSYDIFLEAVTAAISTYFAPGNFRYLDPWLGFAAGWMFLCAKNGIGCYRIFGFAGYLLNATGQESTWLVLVAVGTVAVLTGIVLSGIRISNRVNVIIVTTTLLSFAGQRL